MLPLPSVLSKAVSFAQYDQLASRPLNFLIGYVSSYTNKPSNGTQQQCTEKHTREMVKSGNLVFTIADIAYYHNILAVSKANLGYWLTFYWYTARKQAIKILVSKEVVGLTQTQSQKHGYMFISQLSHRSLQKLF